MDTACYRAHRVTVGHDVAVGGEVPSPVRERKRRCGVGMTLGEIPPLLLADCPCQAAKAYSGTDGSFALSAIDPFPQPWTRARAVAVRFGEFSGRHDVFR